MIDYMDLLYSFVETPVVDGDLKLSSSLESRLVWIGCSTELCLRYAVD